MYPLESQTVSLHPEFRALIISKYQQCILSLASRILSDPCELVSVITFNGEHQQGASISSLATFCHFVSKLSALLPHCPGANIILTLFRLGSSEDLGENVEQGGSFGREMLHKSWNYVLYWCSFFFIEHDSFSLEGILQKTSIVLRNRLSSVHKTGIHATRGNSWR